MHEEAEAAGLHSVYDGPWEFFVGGGGAALDCDGSGFPSVFLAGGKNPARALRQQVQGRRAAQVRGEAARHRRRSEAARPMSSAPIRSTSTATATWICSCSGRRQPPAQGRSRTARSRSPTTNGISTAIRAGPPRSPPSGSRGRNSRRSRSAITSTATRPARPGAPARTIRSIVRSRRQARLFRAHAARARLLRALDAVHRLEQVGHAVAARLQRPAILPRRRGADVAHRAGQDAAALLARRRLAAFVDLRHGHRRRRSRRLGLSANISSPRWATRSCRSSIPTRPDAAKRPSIATSPAKSA